MPESVRCPDCGHLNPAERESCEACNFPLRETAGPTPREADAAVAEPAARAASSEPAITIRRPVRRPRPRPAASGLSLGMWLFFGTICAIALVYTGFTSFVKSNTPVVEGSNEDQQKRAGQLAATLEKDSTDVEAHVGLADILYDTGNWSEAIVHYRAALRRDSTRTTAIVDLGVCYYNLGESGEAERQFQRALALDPHQPVALFNLGIVHERREEWDEALRYYHRAMESRPPEGMMQPLLEKMREVQEKAGRKAPPLPDGK